MEKNMKVIVSLVFVLLTSSLSFSQTSTNAVLPKVILAKGDIAPDFTLNDQNGKSVKLSKLVKKMPVVLVFYRGFW
jgi:cytochrome oxidase Cu insertion factor (SCO1/SenC/PrrC family)